MSSSYRRQNDSGSRDSRNGDSSPGTATPTPSNPPLQSQNSGSSTSSSSSTTKRSTGGGKSSPGADSAKNSSRAAPPLAPNSDPYRRSPSGTAEGSSTASASTAAPTPVISGGGPPASSASFEREILELKNQVGTQVQKQRHLAGEVERQQHANGLLKAENKKLLSDMMDLTATKNQFSKQVEELLAEKEQLRHDVLSASHSAQQDAIKLRRMNLELQARLDAKDEEIADRDNTILLSRGEIDRLRTSNAHVNASLARGGNSGGGADGGDGDGGDGEKPTNIHEMQLKLIRLELTNTQLNEQVERLTTVSNDTAIQIGQVTTENEELKDHLRRARAFISRAGLVMPRKGDGKGVHGVGDEPVATSGLDGAGELLSATADDDGRGKYICIDELRAKEELSIEREALAKLLEEGAVLFEDVFNAHRVMRSNAYEEAERALHAHISRGGATEAYTSGTVGGTALNVTAGKEGTSSPTRSGSNTANGAVISDPGPIYATSWFKGRGDQTLQSWFAHNSNIFSPSMVQTLVGHGFADVLSLVNITDHDLAEMQVTAGMRRRVLAAVTEVQRKLAVIEEETDLVLRNSFGVVLPARQADQQDPDGPAGEAIDPVTGAPKTKSRRRAVYDDLSDMYKTLETWFADAKAAVDSQESAVNRVLQITTLKNNAEAADLDEGEN